MKCYIIKYENEIVGVTNNFEKWLEENNKKRIQDGNEPETKYTFNIIETEINIFDNNEMYQVTSVCKDDLISAFEGRDDFKDKVEIIKELKETDMKWIAKKLADSFCNCCYWDTIRDLVDNWRS